MKPGMKMLMLTGRGNEKGREDGYKAHQNYGESNYGRMGYDGAQGNYVRPEGNYSGVNNRSNYTRNEYENEMRDMETRFRGREGRDDHGHRRESQMTYPMEENYVEERRRFPRRKDGTFAPRSEYDIEDGWHGSPYIPPVYEEDERRMKPIGFVPNEYSTWATHHTGNEMEHRNGQMEHGGASGKSEKLTREMAEEWMANLENEDGTKGPHWTLEQAKQVMAQRGIQCDPIKFWAALNAEYSDRSAVNKKYNVNNIDFYADSAMAAWIKDRDAVSDKLAAYYMHVAKH